MAQFSPSRITPKHSIPSKSKTFSNTFPVTLEYFENSSRVSLMATMASMMLKSAALPNCGATQRSSMGHIYRMPLKSLQVKCMAETDSEPKEASPTSDTPSPSTSATPTPTPTRSFAAPVPPKQVSTKFGDVFAFSGPAPETINGRLAMVGFVSAVAVELASGEDLVSQLSSGGVSWFVLSAVMLSVASLVPLFKGISAESKSQLIFSSSAEMWKGRLAMIGLVALAVTEYVLLYNLLPLFNIPRV